VTIGVADTGAYPAQRQLNDLFALPLLTNGGRKPARHFSVRADSTVYCNHGTRIAGLAAAPADGAIIGGPNLLGVAWGADLVTVKMGDGVVHHGGPLNNAGSPKTLPMASCWQTIKARG
jgi:hypothetical protein